jgi:hypothetical protein
VQDATRARDHVVRSPARRLVYDDDAVHR